MVNPVPTESRSGLLCCSYPTCHVAISDVCGLDSWSSGCLHVLAALGIIKAYAVGTREVRWPSIDFFVPFLPNVRLPG